MRLYIIGPVTGRENDNRPAFTCAQADLVSAGISADIPHEHIESEACHQEAMLRSINRMTSYKHRYAGYGVVGTIGRYDGVALLDGWEESQGALAEKAVCDAVGLPCKTVDEWVAECGWGSRV